MTCHANPDGVDKKQYGRQLNTSATARIPPVWIRKICQGKYEAFYRSKRLSDLAEAKIQRYRSLQVGACKDAMGHEPTSSDVT